MSDIQDSLNDGGDQNAENAIGQIIGSSKGGERVMKSGVTEGGEDVVTVSEQEDIDGVVIETETPDEDDAPEPQDTETKQGADYARKDEADGEIDPSLYGIMADAGVDQNLIDIMKGQPAEKQREVLQKYIERDRDALSNVPKDIYSQLQQNQAPQAGSEPIPFPNAPQASQQAPQASYRKMTPDEIENIRAYDPDIAKMVESQQAELDRQAREAQTWQQRAQQSQQQINMAQAKRIEDAKTRFYDDVTKDQHFKSIYAGPQGSFQREQLESMAASLVLMERKRGVELTPEQALQRAHRVNHMDHILGKAKAEAVTEVRGQVQRRHKALTMSGGRGESQKPKGDEAAKSAIEAIMTEAGVL